MSQMLKHTMLKALKALDVALKSLNTDIYKAAELRSKLA